MILYLYTHVSLYIYIYEDFLISYYILSKEVHEYPSDLAKPELYMSKCSIDSKKLEFAFVVSSIKRWPK